MREKRKEEIFYEFLKNLWNKWIKNEIKKGWFHEISKIYLKLNEMNESLTELEWKANQKLRFQSHFNLVFVFVVL